MTDSPGVLFQRLLDIMKRLREPGGCPWDREQTPTSLKPFLLEEAYEVLEAIESGRSAAVREELGDLMVQVVFHARLAEEQGDFAMTDLLAQLIDKMVRRHPHVFADATVGTPNEALVQWEAIKQQEAEARGQRRSLLDGVPRALPSLRRAQRETVMKLRIGQSSISIERGDITDWEVDAIINAASSTLAMATGVASTIKRKGGVIIEEEAMRQGPVEIGEAVLTTGGNLAATHVIHAAVMGPDFKTDGEQIATTTRAVLALAAKHRITSLALPALGTGVGHVPPAVSASAMLNAVVSHLKGSPSGLKRVVFVLYQDDAYKAFTDTLKRLGGVQ